MSYNQKHYRLWTSLDTVEWIVSINCSKYEKYRNTLITSFNQNNFNGYGINDLDREDLQSYGIINLEDRKAIYKSILQLMTKQKRRDSQTKSIYYDTQQILSLSDDDMDDYTAPKQDYNTLLSTKQLEQLQCNGYCAMVDDEFDNILLVRLITGWMRVNYDGNGMIPEIINAIVYFHGAKYDTEQYVQVQSGDNDPKCYLTARHNMQLCKLFCDQPGDILLCPQVPAVTLEDILLYLGHHKGIEPDPLPCPVRSIHMNQIVSDQWDATYIDERDKKTIFEIILAANYMDIKCLVHLGAAKIATLIKQLDQSEINTIIEEEERYRREQEQKQSQSIFD